jgi:hypothetical protein
VQDGIIGNPAARPLEGGRRRGGGDVSHEGLDATDGADLVEVDAHNRRPGRQGFRRHLQPAAGGRAQVQDGAGIVQKPELAVELDELEGGAGTETVDGDGG